VEHLEVELLRHQLRARAAAAPRVRHAGHCRRRGRAAPAGSSSSSPRLLKLSSPPKLHGMAGAGSSKTA
jgi:hypothetical protein